MLDLYKKKLEAEIKKLEAETEETKIKWYKKTDSLLKRSDFILKVLILLAGLYSAFFITRLYDIKNERLELKRDKLEIQLGLIEQKKDSLNNKIIILKNDREKLSELNDSISNSNRNLLNIQTRLKKDYERQKYIITDLTKKIKNIGNTEKSRDIQESLDKLVSNTSPPVVNANAGEDVTICLGESVKLTASGGYTYLWSTGETTKSIYVNPVKTTTYSVKVTRGGITKTDTVIVTVENCSISSDNTNSSFNIYPNPTIGKLKIKDKE